MADLTSKRFGRLKVIGRSEDKIYENGLRYSMWICQCDCGNVIVRKSQGLLNGKTKSCGCLREEIGNKNFKYCAGDIVKTKYGKFEILKPLRIIRQMSKIKDKKYLCRCVLCGETNEILENSLMNNIGSCKACSETRSFGERFFYWFLKQTGVKFETEFSPAWIGKKRFDFYFSHNGKNIIVEIDGKQHYERGHKRLSTEEIIKIDDFKQRIAENNGFSVIRIVCDKADENEIKKKIYESELCFIFNLDEIDWTKCFYMSMSGKQRKACELWNNGIETTKEISEIIGLNQNYVSKLLKNCSDSGFCDYDPNFEIIKGSKRSTNGKTVICKNSGRIYDSASECSRKSVQDFGVFLKGSGITRVCRKERESYKGFRFEYLE